MICLKVKGPRGVQVYLVGEVQRVYRLQGVDITTSTLKSWSVNVAQGEDR